MHRETTKIFILIQKKFKIFFWGKVEKFRLFYCFRLGKWIFWGKKMNIFVVSNAVWHILQCKFFSSEVRRSRKKVFGQKANCWRSCCFARRTRGAHLTVICGSLEAAKSWCCCSSITVTASLYLIKTFALYALKHTLQMMPSGPTQKKSLGSWTNFSSFTTFFWHISWNGN